MSYELIISDFFIFWINVLHDYKLNIIIIVKSVNRKLTSSAPIKPYFMHDQNYYFFLLSINRYVMLSTNNLILNVTRLLLG